MKKLLILLTAVCFLLCSCGNEEKHPGTESNPAEAAVSYGIDGVYVTDSAYGMEDFVSHLTIKDSTMKLLIENYGVTVEEYEGRYTFENNKIVFTDANSDVKEFVYDPDKKTVYNDEMETTWIIEDLFVPTKEKTEEAAGEEPDPIPENVRGEYEYSDGKMKATITITDTDYRLVAESEGSESLDITGDAVYAGDRMLMMDDGNSIECPLDEENGTLEYDGFLFKKK